MIKRSALLYTIMTQSEKVRPVNSIPDEITDIFYEEGIEPSPQSIDVILNFARSYDVQETESLGQIEFMLN